MVIVRIPGVMRAQAGGSPRVEVRGTTVREALEDLAAKHPGLGGRVFDGQGALRRFVNVYVEDEDIRHRDGLDTPLAEGQVVSILPAVSGGA